MVQRVFVVLDEKNNPVATPYDVNLWTDDQYIGWKLLLPEGWSWSTDPDHGPVVMSEDWYQAGGSMPVASGPLNGDDRRLYNAIGPGPTSKPTTFSYEMYVNDPTGAKLRVQKKAVVNGGGSADVNDNIKAGDGNGRIYGRGDGDDCMVDPDISNQPQP